MANLDQLVASVKTQLQPPPRANATASTLQQLSALVPSDVELADLIAGWRVLAQSSQPGEDPATVQRRVTCGELAELASQFTTDPGNRALAIKAWQAWYTAFKDSDDPRQAAMARTFARELHEIEAAVP